MTSGLENDQPPPMSSQLATQVYLLLLHGYPSAFRAEYGTQMAQVFRACYRTEKGRGDRLRLVIFWLHTLIDFISTAPREHLENLGKENSTMKNSGRDAIALLGCIGIILAAFLLLNYGLKHEASWIVMFGYTLDAFVVTGVIGNLIVFLLVKTTQLNAVRVALWTFLIVNGLPAIALLLVASRIDPQFRAMATLVGYAASFLIWFGIHWAWSQTKGRMQPVS